MNSLICVYLYAQRDNKIFCILYLGSSSYLTVWVGVFYSHETIISTEYHLNEDGKIGLHRIGITNYLSDQILQTS